MSDIKTIDSLDATGKKVLVRVDFNVPVKDGVVTDDTRSRAALPTIVKLFGYGARVILMSHLVRPAGTGYEEAFSRRPAALRLSELLGKPVVFASDTVGEDAQAKAAALRDGDVLLLENLRYEDLMRWKLGNLLEKEWTGIYIPEKEKAYDLNGDGINDVCVTDGKPGTEKGVFYIDLSKGQYTLDKNNCLIYNETRMWADRKYLHPIPKTACVINPALGQNDGWEE